MELKDLEEMFKMEQELEIPHKDRWYKQDFDKRELEAEQSEKNCNTQCVSSSVCNTCGSKMIKAKFFGFMVCSNDKCFAAT